LRRTHDTERYYSADELLIASTNAKSSQAAFACSTSQIELKSFSRRKDLFFDFLDFAILDFQKIVVDEKNNLRVTRDPTVGYGFALARIVTLYISDFVL
jgi:hypothetical protein